MEKEQLSHRLSVKSILTNTVLIFFIRLTLGVIFVISSLDKIADPDAFTLSILNYKVIGFGLATATATILPPLELICGLGLILGIYPRSSAFLITAMLVIFTIMVISALIRGLDISCGCFSQNPDAEKIGYLKILENSGMIIMGIWLLCIRDYGVAFIRLFRQKK
ncbi:MAG: DoxX family membrane protein [Bacteroidetes bacterium]|nr:DoxX family membrane protein [Bacteroidota bacterium]